MMANFIEGQRKALAQSEAGYTVTKNKKDARVKIKRVRTISPRTLKEQREDIRLIERAGKRPTFKR